MPAIARQASAAFYAYKPLVSLFIYRPRVLTTRSRLPMDSMLDGLLHIRTLGGSTSSTSQKSDLGSVRLASRTVKEARGACVRGLWPIVAAGVVAAAVIPGCSCSCSYARCCIAGSSRSSIAAVKAARPRRHCTARADARPRSVVCGCIGRRLLVKGRRCCCIGRPWPGRAIEARDRPEHAPKGSTTSAACTRLSFAVAEAVLHAEAAEGHAAKVLPDIA